MYEKAYKVRFELSSKLLAIMFICYRYNFPISFMLTFYENYKDFSLFVFKALSCNKKIPLNDSAFHKVLEESKLLYKQILRGASSRIERNQIINYNKCASFKKPVPNLQHINPNDFSDKYKEFIEQYLLVNIKDIYAEEVELKLSAIDLYEGIEDGRKYI